MTDGTPGGAPCSPSPFTATPKDNDQFLSAHKATDYNGPWYIQSPGHSEAAHVMSVAEIGKLIFKRVGVICPGKPRLVPVCVELAFFWAVGMVTPGCHLTSITGMRPFVEHLITKPACEVLEVRPLCPLWGWSHTITAWRAGPGGLRP